MAGEEFGSYIPTTQVWDIGELQQTDVNSPKFKELLIRLYQQVGTIAQVTNDKDTGFYDSREFLCGQTFFADPNASISDSPDTRRQVYRSVVNFGTLPNAAAKAVAHNIPVNSSFTVTRIYGAATDPVANLWIPLPYVAVVGSNIALWADATYVNINTLATNRSSYTITYVVVEYLKQ